MQLRSVVRRRTVCRQMFIQQSDETISNCLRLCATLCNPNSCKASATMLTNVSANLLAVAFASSFVMWSILLDRMEAICFKSLIRWLSILTDEANSANLSNVLFSKYPKKLLSMKSIHPAVSFELTNRCACPGWMRKRSPSEKRHSLKSMRPHPVPASTKPMT